MEGVRCWDGHTAAHTPNEMHQSSGEGMGEGGSVAGWRCGELVQRVQGGKGISMAAGRGRAPHCRYALATCLWLRPGPQFGKRRVVETLGLGDPSQESGGRVGAASCFCRSGSQCHGTSNK